MLLVPYPYPAGTHCSCMQGWISLQTPATLCWGLLSVVAESAGSTRKRGWKCQEVNDPGTSPQPGTNGSCWINASFFTLRGDTSMRSAIQWLDQAPVTQSTHLPHNTPSVDLLSLPHFPIIRTAASLGIWEWHALKSLSQGLLLGEPNQHRCWREADSMLQG